MWTVNGRDRALEPRASSGFALRKWFRMMMRPPGRQTRRISRATATGSGTTLITIRRVDDVEGVVGELQVGGVHLEQPDVA